jgi:type II secretory pathway pseudopilin PulG
MHHGGETARRANVLEVVGAWLHIWVPPRDVEIPPVPWRKLAIGAGIGVVVVGVALAIMIPRINAGKDSRAARDAASRARAQVENQARVRREQAPHHGGSPALKPPAGAPEVRRAGARMLLVGRLEADVMADARDRAAQGLIRPVAGPTSCRPARGYAGGKTFGVLDCFVVARHIERTERTAAGAIGYPFRAVVDYRHYTYAWCKVEGIPGEGMIPDPRKLVALPRACQAPDTF